MRGTLQGALLALVLTGAAPAAAQACSIGSPPLPPPAVDERALLDDARDVAFATVLARRNLSDPAGPVAFDVRTTRVLRGAPTAERAFRFENHSCDPAPDYDAGEEVAVVDDELHDAAALRRALAPLPSPLGAGRAALLVGGRFGEATVAALDRAGRVLAYGRGGPRALALSVCPGGERFVQADRGRVAVRRVRDLQVVRSVRLDRSTADVRCLDAQGSAAAALGGRRGRVAVVRGTRVRRVGAGRTLALGDRAALVAARGRLREVPYDGDPVRDAGALPSGVTAAAADGGLRRVLLERVVRSRASLVFRDRRTGTTVTRRLPGEPGLVGPRPTGSLAFDADGRPLVGFRDRLRRFDARFGGERVAGGGELLATAGADVWGLDFEGGLWRGRRRVGIPVRKDPTALAALPVAVEVRAP